MKRRQFLFLGLIATLAPLKLLAKKKEECKAAPEGKKILDPKSKQATKSLDYVEVAEQSKNKKYKAPAACSNCKYYRPKKSEKDLGWAKCTMAGNKYVSGCGWCKKYKVDKKKLKTA